MFYEHGFKHVFKKLLPKWVIYLLRGVIRSWPSVKKKRLEQLAKLKRTNELIERIFCNDQIHVLNGPFKGMRYIRASNGSALLPKLVGSYEEPIHKWIYEIIEKREYSTIIDVGCAEGYYAVGFLLAKATPKVLAFDIDKSALENARKLAELNDVTQSISFHEQFDPSVVDMLFKADPSTKILIFMDVEGAELNLLATDKTQSILKCDVLVELHDCFYPGLTEKLLNRFQDSHEIEIVVDYPWRKKKYFLNDRVFNKDDLQHIFDEQRPKAMRWMYAKVI